MGEYATRRTCVRLVAFKDREHLANQICKFSGTQQDERFLLFIFIHDIYRTFILFICRFFSFAILSTAATLLLSEWNERLIRLFGVFDVLFLLTLMMAWTRFEITKNNIDLVNNL